MGGEDAELVVAVVAGRGGGHGRRRTARRGVPVEDLEETEGEHGEEVAVLLRAGTLQDGIHGFHDPFVLRDDGLDGREGGFGVRDGDLLLALLGISFRSVGEELLEKAEGVCQAATGRVGPEGRGILNVACD